jgi:hypothetical protein
MTPHAPVHPVSVTSHTFLKIRISLQSHRRQKDKIIVSAVLVAAVPLSFFKLQHFI